MYCMALLYYIIYILLQLLMLLATPHNLTTRKITHNNLQKNKDVSQFRVQFRCFLFYFVEFLLTCLVVTSYFLSSSRPFSMNACDSFVR